MLKKICFPFKRSAMLGFFRCARELQENDSALPPPTSDMDGMDIDPLSE